MSFAVAIADRWFLGRQQRNQDPFAFVANVTLLISVSGHDNEQQRCSHLSLCDITFLVVQRRYFRTRDGVIIGLWMPFEVKVDNI